MQIAVIVIRLYTYLGIGLSNLISLFIIVTTAAFYCTIGVATVVGVLINFVDIDRIKALF